MFVQNGIGTWKTMNKTALQKYTLNRPIDGISDIGLMIIGPKPNPSTKTDVPLSVSKFRPRSECTYRAER